MARAVSLLQNIIDVDVAECTVYSPTMSSPVNLYQSLLAINFYEDLFSNCITGNIIINDASSFSTKFSWCGEEYLILSFRKNEYSEYTKRTFKIYSMSDRSLGNDTSETYVLNFCSEELLINQKIRINTTYKNKLISDMVKDIALNNLKINPNDFPDSHIEKTNGLYNITIPNLNPLQAINWLCNIAVSDELPNSANGESGAAYLFWQNKDGYYFMSVLSLLNDHANIYRGYNNGGFYWYGTNNSDVNQMIGAQMNIGSDRIEKSQQITSYEVLHSFDSLNALKKGMYSNKTVSIDLVGRNKKEHKFEYTKYFDYLKNNIALYKTEGRFPILSNVPDRFNETDNNYENVNIRIFHTTTDQNKNEYVDANQKGIEDYRIEKCAAYRAAQFALLSHNRIRIVIPGDNNISVGRIIKVYIPSTYIDMKKKTNMENRFLSGYYLVTALRHMINNSGDFRTVLELRKDAYYAISGTDIHGGLPDMVIEPDILKTFADGLF